jgi:hypothetical protein
VTIAALNNIFVGALTRDQIVALGVFITGVLGTGSVSFILTFFDYLAQKAGVKK